jgi:hypothetical protein
MRSLKLLDNKNGCAIIYSHRIGRPQGGLAHGAWSGDKIGDPIGVPGSQVGRKKSQRVLLAVLVVSPAELSVLRAQFVIGRPWVPQPAKLVSGARMVQSS